MKLKDWISSTDGMTLRKMAKDINVCHTSICKYCNGSRRPSAEVAKKIKKYTKGSVTLKELRGK